MMRKSRSLLHRAWPVVAMIVAGPSVAASLATTGPAQPLPDQGMATVSLPIAENLAAGSASLMPLMAAGPPADDSRAAILDDVTGGGDIGKPIDDLSFLALAADGARIELGAARDALARLEDPELKRVAEALIHDHDDAHARLERLAAAKRWPVPPPQKPMTPSAGAASADFEAVWIDETISAHERLAALYGAQAQGGEDGDLRRYARETLPTLQHHLAELRRLQK